MRLFSMDAILLCMKRKGIRFFSRIKFSVADIVRFNKKSSFLGLLNSRRDCYDNVLIMAHGSKKAIIIPSEGGTWDKYITESDVEAFNNDFVFAVSCLTACEFGQKCVEAGAISYLGYQVELGSLFSATQLQPAYIPGRVVLAVNTIIKHIFVEELSRAYEEFLTTVISVQVLKERFALLLEQRIAELPDLSSADLFTKYNVRLNDQNIKKYFVLAVLNALEFLNEVSSHLVLIGNPNYISSTSISYARRFGKSSAEITDHLLNNAFFLELDHAEYKKFLLEAAHF